MSTVPQLGGRPYLTDAGLETCMVFKDGLDLPSFASFVLLDDPQGLERLSDYYREFLAMAAAKGAGFVLDTPTWRANPDWGEAVGYDRDALASINRRAVDYVTSLRDEASEAGPVAINLVLGPRGEGYSPGAMMSRDDARAYHAWQIEQGAKAGADMVSAVTMNYLEEAQGIAAAAADARMPCVVSFTVETDGMLPTGMSLAEAVQRTDDAAPGAVAYYMVNCAHPTHFAGSLGHAVLAERIGGIRANASRMSHAELDEAAELDAGNPAELASEYRKLLGALPNLCVLGGCCGTDHRHVAAVADECLGSMRSRVG